MKILSIGNSFSEDAQRYLKLIAGANGRELTCVNLYIGGCSLKRHYINLIDNEKSYHYQFGGENTGLMVSIKEVLGSNNWDFITLQQASHESTDIANFTPFLPEIADWLRLRCAKAQKSFCTRHGLIPSTWNDFPSLALKRPMRCSKR